MSATLVPLSACRNARRICSSVCPFFATFVSSSFSSRGPRLPLLTQLARGSLFGFWVSTYVSSGKHKWNTVTLDQVTDGRRIRGEGEIDLAARTWKGKLFELS